MNTESRPASRNALLLSLLPGLFLGCVYVLTMRPKSKESIARVEIDLLDARRQLPAPNELENARDRVDELRSKIDEARGQLQAVAAAQEAAARARPTPQNEIEGESLASILLRTNMLVISESRGERSNAEGASVRARFEGTVRRFELRGAFSDMLTTLREIEQSAPALRVLHLAMKRDRDPGGGLTWTLEIG